MLWQATYCRTMVMTMFLFLSWMVPKKNWVKARPNQCQVLLCVLWTFYFFLNCIKMKVKNLDPILLPLSISALMLIVFSLSSSFSYNIPLDDFRSNLAEHCFCLITGYFEQKLGLVTFYSVWHCCHVSLFLTYRFFIKSNLKRNCPNNVFSHDLKY